MWDNNVVIANLYHFQCYPTATSVIAYLQQEKCVYCIHNALAVCLYGAGMAKKISGDLFKKYCELVYKETGINLNESKKELLNARIAKRLRTYSIPPDEYLKKLITDPVELRVFLDVISTNHTFFFREAKTFKYLDTGCNKIWCAASSSGEEPYSLAMYCLEKGFRPSIAASDISDSCLEKARAGIYPEKNAGGIPLHMLRSYFRKGRGRWDGYVKVKDSIHNMINYHRFNLIKDMPENETWDIIFCRNVMIYFDNAVKTMVVNKLTRVLRKNGHFIIGGAESLNGIEHSLKYVEPSVYRND